MEIEIIIKSANLDKETVQKLIDMFDGKLVDSEKPTQEAQQEPQNPQEPQEQKTYTNITLEDLANEARKALDNGARDELKGLLTTFNVLSLKDLKPETYGDFMSNLINLNRRFGGGSDE